MYRYRTLVKQVGIMSESLPDLVPLNVGGIKYQTYLSTLRKAEGSLLGAMFSGRHPLTKDSDGSFVIDRDGKHFGKILNYLRTDHVVVPSKPEELQELLLEAEYFQLSDVVDAIIGQGLHEREIGMDNILLRERDEELRTLFATKRDDPKLEDPFVGLINVFEGDNLKHFYPVRDESWQQIRAPKLFNFVRDDSLVGPSVCHSKDRFLRNWKDFTFGAFDGFDWSNVVAAGGSVLACLQDGKAKKFDHSETGKHAAERSKVPNTFNTRYRFFGHHDPYNPNLKNLVAGEEDDLPAAMNRVAPNLTRKRQIEACERQVARFRQFRRSDVDLFLYGLDSDEEAINIIRRIYNRLKETTSYVTVVRSQYAVSFLLPYPRPVVQVVLRLYKSPAEVLHGFDIDSCCLAFDGSNILCAERAKRALNGRINLVDAGRMSTTYESRLYKYTKRGFAIAVPGLEKDRINPELYKQTNLKNLKGIARLLWLENKAKDSFSPEDGPQPHRYIFNGSYAQREDDDADDDTDDTNTPVLQEKLRKSDYRGFRFLPNPSTPPFFALSGFVNGALSRREEKKLPIVFALNDIEKIIDTGKTGDELVTGICFDSFMSQDVQVSYQLEEVPHRIHFIKENAGSQKKIGSFHPMEFDMFCDVYAKENTSKTATVDDITKGMGTVKVD